MSLDIDCFEWLESLEIPESEMPEKDPNFVPVIPQRLIDELNPLHYQEFCQLDNLKTIPGLPDIENQCANSVFKNFLAWMLPS